MRYSFCVPVLALLVGACGGTETDNPLAEFKRSGCKNHGENLLTLASDTRPAEPLPGDTSQYDGLFCFEYLADGDGVITVDVFNYRSACGADFSGGSAAVADGRLTLSLHRENCEATRCGSCYHDLSFRVEGVELLSGHEVQLQEVGCEGTAVEQDPVMLTFARDHQDDVEQATYCRSIALEPVSCATDDDCRADLERCSSGTCQPRLTF